MSITNTKENRQAIAAKLAEYSRAYLARSTRVDADPHDLKKLNISIDLAGLESYLFDKLRGLLGAEDLPDPPK